MTSRPTFVLASASPARLQLLRTAGLDPEVIVSGVDESIVESTNPQVLCSTLARLKAEAVAVRLRQRGPAGRGSAIVLGCDSVLEFDGEVMGKPIDDEDAAQRWRRMRGRTGILHTGHCLVNGETGKLAESATRTEVRFGDISDAELAAYVASGEPQQVAGSFTIDGRGGWFIDEIVGDHGTVIGVSLPTLRRLLAELGIAVTDLWRAP
jgi:septum formation protein